MLFALVDKIRVARNLITRSQSRKAAANTSRHVLGLKSEHAQVDRAKHRETWLGVRST